MTCTEEGGGATNCTIVDTADGQVVVQSPVFGATSRSGSDGSWIGSTTFDPGSGDLEVTCGTGGGARVQIGPEVSVGGLIGGILLTVLAALVLGGAGLVVLIVTGVLFVTRPPRGH